MSEQENVLKHKGLQGSVEVSFEDNVLHGRVLCINDLVTFEAQTPEGLRQAFETQVNEYMEFCEDEGVVPDKPFSGGWIPVYEQLPDIGQVVLAYFPHRTTMKVDIEELMELREAPVSFSSETVYTGVFWSESDYDDITHWMPLPKPPHQAEEDDIEGKMQDLLHQRG